MSLEICVIRQEGHLKEHFTIPTGREKLHSEGEGVSVLCRPWGHSWGWGVPVQE